MPIPGSAQIPTTAPSPASARASASPSEAISASRPTKREKPRSRERSRRERAEPTPVSSKTSTGWLAPLISNSPSSFSSRKPRGEGGGALGEEGLAGLGQRLHPLRQSDRVADRGVGTLAAGADRACHHLAGVDPDPGGEVEPLGAAQLGGVGGDVVEHLQRRVTGAARMVLVGDRGAEDGHDPVAGELVDGALEALDRLGEDGEEALHDLAPLLRVLPLGQVHRAAHVGEEHRHLLALAIVLADLGHASEKTTPPTLLC